MIFEFGKQWDLKSFSTYTKQNGNSSQKIANSKKVLISFMLLRISPSFISNGTENWSTLYFMLKHSYCNKIFMTSIFNFALTEAKPVDKIFNIFKNQFITKSSIRF